MPRADAASRKSAAPGGGSFDSLAGLYNRLRMQRHGARELDRATPLAQLLRDADAARYASTGGGAKPLSRRRRSS